MPGWYKVLTFHVPIFIFKCTKTGMIDEAEEPINKVNGSEGMTVRCVTHHGHCLDGTRLVASHRERDWAPTMYIP